MTCSDINKLLKPFLDDLLIEQESNAFVSHLEDCSKCEKYVRSLGSISNQVWKLGKIKVPKDLSSTVLFQARQLKATKNKSGNTTLRKLIIVFFIVLFLGVVTFSIYFYPGKNKPVVEDEVIRETEPKDDQPIVMEEEARDDSGSILIRVEPSPEDKIIEGISDNLSSRISEKTKDNEKAANLPAPFILESKLLHWHFAFSEDFEKSRFQEILVNNKIRLDYQDYDLLSFKSSGRNIEEALEDIMLELRDASLDDYTSIFPIFPEKDYDISIYLDRKKASLLHWHIKLAVQQQKLNLLKAIKTSGGRIKHEIEDLIAFSISVSELDKLKARIQAMRVSFEEFGEIDLEPGQLISRPVKITIYMVK